MDFKENVEDARNGNMDAYWNVVYIMHRVRHISPLRCNIHVDLQADSVRFGPSLVISTNLTSKNN